MAFKISLNKSAEPQTYTVPVIVHTPKKTGGGFDESKFKATFMRCDVTLLDELKELPQIEVQKRVLVGFSDLVDDDDNDLEFNENNKEALLTVPQAVLGLSEAFWSSIYKAKTKN